MNRKSSDFDYMLFGVGFCYITFILGVIGVLKYMSDNNIPTP